MKTILIILTASFFISNINTSEQEKRVTELRCEGYTKQAAEHIAKVEFKIIPESAEYNALMED